MGKKESVWKKYQGWFWFGLFVIQAGLVYKIIQWIFSVKNYWSFSWESQIPFLTVFVIPYLLFYAFLFLPFILSYKNKKIFSLLSVTYFVAASILNVLFVALRTGVVRYEFEITGILTKMVALFYQIDGVLNSFPSGHVTFSVLTSLCLGDINKKFALWSWPLTILIVLSTVLIKQHYVIDIVGGVVLAVACYFLVFKKIMKSKWFKD